jgi:ubiquitin C-terminal hydrolase
MFILEKLNRPQVLTQRLEQYSAKTIDMDIEKRKAARLKRTTSSHHQLNRIAKIPNVENDFIENGFQLGIQNFGNTCYINAVTQCMFSIKSISVFCHNFEVVHDLTFDYVEPNRLYSNFMKLMEAAWLSTDPQSINERAREFVNDFQQTFSYQKYEQQDATEAYYFFTEHIDTYFNAMLRHEVDNMEITLLEYVKKINGLNKLSRVIATKTFECLNCGNTDIVESAHLNGFQISLNRHNGANTIEQYIREQNLVNNMHKSCVKCSVPTYRNINNVQIVDNKPHLERYFIRKLPDFFYCILNLFERDVSND